MNAQKKSPHANRDSKEDFNSEFLQLGLLDRFEVEAWETPALVAGELTIPTGQ